MQQVGTKIYYDNTGTVVLVTPEMQGCVERMTKEQDFAFYPDLKDRSMNDIDFIELDYGTSGAIFKDVKTFRVDIKTKKLVLVHYTENELYEQQQREDIARDSAKQRAGLAMYLSMSDTATIADIENAILQIELSKSLGGM